MYILFNDCCVNVAQVRVIEVVPNEAGGQVLFYFADSEDAVRTQFRGLEQAKSAFAGLLEAMSAVDRFDMFFIRFGDDKAVNIAKMTCMDIVEMPAAIQGGESGAKIIVRFVGCSTAVVMVTLAEARQKVSDVFKYLHSVRWSRSVDNKQSS